MQQVDDYTLRQNLFGKQIDNLSETLVAADPKERVMALQRLSGYISDCTKPLLALQVQVKFAAAKAVREMREAERKAAAQGLSDDKQNERLWLASGVRKKPRSRNREISDLVTLVGER